MEIIKKFGNVYTNKYSFKECPTYISKERKYKLSGKYNNILTKTGTDNWMGIICNKELDKLIEEHKWKIKILNSKKKFVMVGVAPIDFDINSSNHNTCGWYLHCWGSYLESGPPHRYKAKNSGLSEVDDEIIVVMNMHKRTLKFIINNEDKGTSFKDIPIDKPLYPAVLLCDQNDSIEITEC